MWATDSFAANVLYIVEKLGLCKQIGRRITGSGVEMGLGLHKSTELRVLDCCWGNRQAGFLFTTESLSDPSDDRITVSPLSLIPPECYLLHMSGIEVPVWVLVWVLVLGCGSGNTREVFFFRPDLLPDDPGDKLTVLPLPVPNRFTLLLLQLPQFCLKLITFLLQSRYFFW